MSLRLYFVAAALHDNADLDLLTWAEGCEKALMFWRGYFALERTMPYQEFEVVDATPGMVASTGTLLPARNLSRNGLHDRVHLVDATVFICGWRGTSDSIARSAGCGGNGVHALHRTNV